MAGGGGLTCVVGTTPHTGIVGVVWKAYSWASKLDLCGDLAIAPMPASSIAKELPGQCGVLNRLPSAPTSNPAKVQRITAIMTEALLAWGQGLLPAGAWQEILSAVRSA